MCPHTPPDRELQKPFSAANATVGARFRAMRGTQLSLRHLFGAGALASSLLLAGLSFASLPAGAQTAPAATTSGTVCPTLSLANPSPGDNLMPGGLVISGEAFDPAAPAGTAGIQRVDLFLGLRDQGGTILGSAVPGATTGENARFFSTEVTIPNVNQGDVFAVYAISSVTGQETSVSFPIFIGTPPKNTSGATPTPVPTEATETSTCPAGVAAPVSAAAPSVSAPSVAMTPSAAASTGASTTASNACPVLSLANPGPGDTMQAGGLFISGAATDSAAATSGGSGVQRVDLFLGERDQGGMFLGSATPGTVAGGSPDAFSIEVSVPNLGKGVDFAAYAIGDNGQQTAITFPVFVGSQPANTTGAATPTPIPTSETVTSTCGH